MTWAQINDNLPGNPKVRAVSVAARWAYVASICYATANLTDGFIPRSSLGLVDGTPRIARELVGAGLWEVADGGWQIHDYLEHNRSRAQVLAERERARLRRRGEAVTTGDVRPNVRRTSGEHPANIARTSGERLPNVGRTSDERPRPEVEVELNTLKGVSHPTGDANTDPGVRERAEMILMRLPLKFRRDPLTIDEAEQLARDITDAAAIVEAQERIRRTNALPFPSAIRRELTPAEPAPKRPVVDLGPPASQLYAGARRSQT